MGSYVSGGGGAVILIFLLHLIICMTVVVDGAHPVPARKKVAVEGVVYCQDCTRDPNNNFQLVTTQLNCSSTAAQLQLFLLSSPQLNCSSTRNPYPEPDGTPWFFGRPLKAITNSSSSSLSNNNDIQFYTTDSPLLFYPHWSACT